ncbi:hypothetical protein AG1IA_09770 [Rhizoctonia solani AG-1 IA]|uniref:Uncharacterized protein n=1 Tax=Thanatephorus cucumeris (strain AG1-IA) TaxID=983506 RepID=L8WIM5_THACA|nr:hypothetical protein AG1IA_09770 [Rhizoctonia solani AG-1 IA]
MSLLLCLSFNVVNQASGTVESTAAVGYLHHLSEMNVTVQPRKSSARF